MASCVLSILCHLTSLSAGRMVDLEAVAANSQHDQVVEVASIDGMETSRRVNRAGPLLI